MANPLPKKVKLQLGDPDGNRDPISLVRFRQAEVEPKKANTLLRFQQHVGTTEATQNSRIVVAESDSIAYHGAASVQAHPLQPTYVVARRRQGDSTLTVYPANVFSLQPVLKREAHLATQSKALDTSDKVMQARNDLTETFGGKKKKAALHAVVRNQLKADSLAPMSSVIGAALDTSIAQGNMNDVEAAADKNRPLPRFNKKAEVPADAYPIRYLISHEEARALKVPCQELNKATLETVAKWKSVNKYSPLVLDGCDVLVTKTGNAKKTHARIVQYLVELLKFYHYTTKNRFISKADVQATLRSMPEEVLGRLMDKFVLTDPSGERITPSARGNQMPKRSKHLLLHHILVFALHARNFNAITTTAVANALGLSILDAGNHLRAIGCKLRSVAAKDGKPAHHIAELKLPLEFPRIRTAVARR